jgi:hypothetical protein
MIWYIAIFAVGAVVGATLAFGLSILVDTKRREEAFEKTKRPPYT